MSEDEKLLCAKQLHIDAGLDPRQQVSFTNVSSFKKQLNVKIVIFIILQDENSYSVSKHTTHRSLKPYICIYTMVIIMSLKAQQGFSGLAIFVIIVVVHIRLRCATRVNSDAMYALHCVKTTHHRL